VFMLIIHLSDHRISKALLHFRNPMVATAVGGMTMSIAIDQLPKSETATAKDVAAYAG